MATGKFGKRLHIDETKSGGLRVLGTVCRIIVDDGVEVQTDEIQVEVFVSKAEFLSLTGAQILDKLKVEVGELAKAAKATDTQKRFAGLAIS